jgi:hypothetical protein
LESQEEFKTLLEALKGYQANSLDSGYKTLGFMVIALGWLITSEGARTFLKANWNIRFATLIFLGLSVIGYGFMAYRVYSLSRSVLAKLERLGYAKREVYEHYAISKVVPVYYTVFHFLISTLIAVVIIN